MISSLSNETLNNLITEWKSFSDSYKERDRSLHNLMNHFEIHAFTLLKHHYYLSQHNAGHRVFVRTAIVKAVNASGDWSYGYADAAAEELRWDIQDVSQSQRFITETKASDNQIASNSRSPLLQRLDTREKRLGLVIFLVGVAVFAYGLIGLSKSWQPLQSLTDAVLDPGGYNYRRYTSSAWGVYLMLLGMALPYISRSVRKVWKWVDRGSES